MGRRRKRRARKYRTPALPSRRNFIKIGLGFLSACGSLASILPYVERLFPPTALPGPGITHRRVLSESLGLSEEGAGRVAAYRVKRHPDDKD